MCGIIGLYGDDLNVNVSEKKNFMIDGLIVDTLRGADSTGIACVPRKHDDSVLIYKRDLPGYEFVQLKKTIKLIDNMYNYIAVLGHNRSATRGSVTDENAHPFRYGHITMIHNGTVTNSDTLVAAKDRPNNAKVDSAQVCHAFSHETAEDMLPKLLGGYSLVWFDDSDMSLNFARNDYKPMYIAIEATRQAFYFASEAEMLTLLCRRQQPPIAIQEEIFNLLPYVHYKFKNPKNVREVIKRPFAQKTVSYLPPMGGIGHRSGTAWKPTDTTTNTPTLNTSIGGDATVPSKSGGTVVPFNRPGSGNPPFTKNGSAHHPYKDERLTPNLANTYKKGALSDETKNRLSTLMAECQIKDTVVAKPVFWSAYVQGHVDDKIPTSGVMVCEANKPNTTESFFFQVFDVSHRRWNDELKDVPVILEPINYRTSIKFQGWPPVFVCRIKEDLQQKHFGSASTSDRKKALADLEAQLTYTDPGAKADWIEIGTSRKRLVSPGAFAVIAKNGCCNCDKELTLDNKDKFMWIGIADDRAVCDDCADNPQILEAIQYMQ